MKKILLSTTLLVATAGVAAAEVTLSGSGRFGVTYDESRGGEEVQLNYRMRVEFNGKVETDSGVTFGGRIRLQGQQGSVFDGDVSINNNGTPLDPTDDFPVESNRGGATLSQAYLSASYAGFQLQVGNANGALDSAALMYNSELGFTGFSAGDPSGFEAFSSDPYGAGQENRVGIFVTYGLDDLNVYASYHTSNQTVDGRGTETYSVAADYKFDAFTISGGYQNVDPDTGGSTDYFAIAGEYAVNDAANIGLQYFNISGPSGLVNPSAEEDSDKITAYANYTFDAVTLRAFFSYQDDEDLATTEEVAYGIGVDYDLGGATLAAGIQNNFNDDIYAEAGVKFSF